MGLCCCREDISSAVPSEQINFEALKDMERIDVANDNDYNYTAISPPVAVVHPEPISKSKNLHETQFEFSDNQTINNNSGAVVMIKENHLDNIKTIPSLDKNFLIDDAPEKTTSLLEYNELKTQGESNKEQLQKEEAHSEILLEKNKEKNKDSLQCNEVEQSSVVTKAGCSETLDVSKENNNNSQECIPFVPVVKKQWAPVETKMPRFSSRTSLGTEPQSPISDPFEPPPNLKDGCYLTFTHIKNGTLKLTYSKTSETINERIIAVALLKKSAPDFKYKNPVIAGQEIINNLAALNRAIADFIRVAVNGNCLTQFFPLPPGFPPFVVAYNYQDETIKLQYAGEDSIEFSSSQPCVCAAVGEPILMKPIQKAAKLSNILFKKQFLHHPNTCILTF